MELTWGRSLPAPANSLTKVPDMGTNVGENDELGVRLPGLGYRD